MKFIHLIRCNIRHVASEQMWRIMKLIIVIMTAFLIQVSAASKAQQLTIKDSNISLREVITQIRKQTGYTVFAPSSLINKAKPLNLNLDKTPLKEALERITTGQNFDYTLNEKAIVISEKEKPNFLERIIDHFDNIDVRGRVVDEKGNPLPGASVGVVGGKSTKTNQNGDFDLLGVDKEAVVKVSYIGYKDALLKATENMGIVKMSLSNSKLDEVQVIAYGTTTQRLSTGNTAMVKAEDIEKQPVRNVMQALEGRVPGLVVTQQNGLPGSGFNIRLRGINTIGNDPTPLFVIDGIPYSSELPMPIVNLNLGGGSPLNYINVNDIESVSVLKDADATSIYGSRAANGAILITTKKGKPGKLKVNVNVSSGLSTPARDVKLLNTQQYLEMRREAFHNDSLANPLAGIKPGPGDHDLNGDWDINRYTDWSKELVQKPAPYLNSQISLSGGAENINYLISGSYNHQNSPYPVMIPNQGIDQLGTIHFNLNANSNDKRFKIQLTGSYSSNKNTIQDANLSQFRFSLAPNAPSLLKPDGSLNWAPLAPGQLGTFDNPYASLFVKSKYLTGNLLGNLALSYNILPSLEVKTTIGYNNLRNDGLLTVPTSSKDPGLHSNSGNSIFQYMNSTSLIAEPQLNYHIRIGRGEFSALVGATLNNVDNHALRQEATGYLSDALLEDVQSATSVINTTVDSKYRYNAIFARLGYNLGNKYLINLNVRRDGSSRFGPGKQFGDFGSLAGAWVFSEENLIKNAIPFLSFGKIRGSYGTAGNDGIGNYKFLDLYSPGSYSYQGVGSLIPQGVFNPDFAWELTKKAEIGLDLGFLKDRILLGLSYYKNVSNNQLISARLPLITGFAGTTANLPASLQNRGLELTLNTSNIQTKAFSWTSAINFSFNRNKLLAYPDLSTSSVAGILSIGESATALRGLIRYGGLNPTTGFYQFYNKDGKITTVITNDDKVAIDLTPKYTGGFQNTFRYKDFSLDIFFQFAKQMGKKLFTALPQPGSMYNQPIDVLNRWQKPGDNDKDFQAFTQNRAGFLPFLRIVQSDYAYTDASFVRLKTASFSWQIPEKWKQKINAKNFAVNIQAQNLFTITPYTGIDPETQGTNTAPMKTWTIGLQVGF